MNVSKPVAVTFTVLLVAALMTVAYLLGLDHARRHEIREEPLPAPSPSPTPAAAPAPSPSEPPPPAAQPAPSPPPTTATPVIATPAAPTAAPPPVESAPSPAPTPVTPPAPAASPEATAVRGYFTQMDSLAGVNPFGDDAQGAADKLLTSAMSGDTSGFDALSKIASDAVAKAQSVKPPSACSHYHQELVVMLQESVQVLATLKGAIAKSDSNALLAIAGTAQSLKSRGDALTREAASIKARYGLR